MLKTFPALASVSTPALAPAPAPAPATAQMLLGQLGKFAITCPFALVYVYSVELLPTVARSALPSPCRHLSQERRPGLLLHLRQSGYCPRTFPLQGASKGNAHGRGDLNNLVTIRTGHWSRTLLILNGECSNIGQGRAGRGVPLYNPCLK